MSTGGLGVQDLGPHFFGVRKDPEVVTEIGTLGEDHSAETEGSERRGNQRPFTSWDVRRAKIFGRCEHKTGIAPFERLVAQVMRQEPYRSARRVFWIMDNGSSHRGAKADARLSRRWPTLIPIHTPIHASWLNQVEIYFSVVERKALTPNDFASLRKLKDRLLRFQEHYERVARPFQWKFTRRDLAQLMAKLKEPQGQLAKAA